MDLRAVVNRGLRDGAHRAVPAWTDEGANDMRNLPTGRRRFGVIQFDVIDPRTNGGRAVLRLDAEANKGPQSVTFPVPNRKARSLYFLHALAHSVGAHALVGLYDVIYQDGTTARIHVRNNHEIGLWWGLSDGVDLRRGNNPVDRSITRVAWRGANGQWKNVGLFMNGWNNPHPNKAITAIRVEAVKAGGRGAGIMLAGISLSDSPVEFETRIRSHGLPDCWSQAAVYYALAEGLAGIEDAGKAFDHVRIAPRWAAGESSKADVTLHYPASDGYCAYSYRLEKARRRIVLDVTGSFTTAQIHCLLPKGARLRRVSVDGKELPFKLVRVEKSAYADFALEALPAGPVTVEF